MLDTKTNPKGIGNNMNFTVNNKKVEFNSVEELFRTKRSERNQLFGQYITSVGKKEEANLDEILKLVKAKQVECNQWQKNLETLVEAMEEEAKKVAAAKLQNAVDAMDAEQLAKLKELIEKKEKQQ